MDWSHSGSLVLVLRGKVPIAVMTLIRSQRVVAKLIENNTGLLQSTSAASGGSEGGCCSVPPPPRASYPKSWAVIPPL